MHRFAFFVASIPRLVVVRVSLWEHQDTQSQQQPAWNEATAQTGPAGGDPSAVARAGTPRVTRSRLRMTVAAKDEESAEDLDEHLPTTCENNTA